MWGAHRLVGYAWHDLMAVASRTTSSRTVGAWGKHLLCDPSQRLLSMSEQFLSCATGAGSFLLPGVKS